MKRRVIALCLTFSMLISLIPSMAIVSNATTFQSGKTTSQLTEVKVYDESNSLTADYKFHYDGDYLTDVDTRTYGEYSYESSVVLTYDAEGRLISKISGDPDTPGMNSGTKYTYDNAGNLITMLQWEGGAVETTYEYDSLGNCIREVEKSDTSSKVTEYQYNEDNLIDSAIETFTEEWSNNTWSAFIDYTYDTQKRVTKVSSTGGQTNSTTTYNYQFQPLVLYEYTDSNGFNNSYLLLQDNNGDTLHSFYLTNPELYSDNNGNLGKVVDTESFSNQVKTYVFSYTVIPERNDNSYVSSNTGEWNKTYYDFIVEDRNTSGWKSETYELIYVDNDEIPEIWIYYEPTGQRGELISYQSGDIVKVSTGRWEFEYAQSNKYLHCAGGTFGTGGCWNTIYALENGTFKEVASGSHISATGNYDETVVYSWDDQPVPKETYYSNIDNYLDPEITKTTYSEDSEIYSYDGILEYLTSINTEEPDDFENYSREAWIEQHLTYASSNEYESDIVSGYSQRMLAVFRDALDDGGIKGYSTAKTTTKLLGLDFDLSESDVYELLLAEILYSRPSLQVTQESFLQNLTDETAKTTGFLVEMVKSARDAKEIPDNLCESITKTYELLMSYSISAPEYAETYNKFISLIDKNFTKAQLKVKFTQDVQFLAAGIVVDSLFETYNSVGDVLNYINYYAAYQKTTQQFQRILEHFLRYLYINQGLYGVGQFSELGITEAMFNWSDLITAIVSFLETAKQYEQELSVAVAEYAVEKAKETGSAMLENTERAVVVFGLDKLCMNVPILREIFIAKAVVNVGLFITECTTNVDDRKYALSMLTKLYCISVMMDEVVDDCVDYMNSESKEEELFFNTTVFDEAVDIYKGTQLLAADYAISYTDLVLANAIAELEEYDESTMFQNLFKNRDKLEQTVTWYSNSLKLLEEQKEDIGEILCHDSNISYNPYSNEVKYDFYDSRIHVVACPVALEVTDPTGATIAYLSNEEYNVLNGYEYYFRLISFGDGPNDYIKIAIIPTGYSIKLHGTDDGNMNAFVTNYGSTQEPVETFFNVPINKKTEGYFTTNNQATTTRESVTLLIDDVEYRHMDSIDDVPARNHSENKWLWIFIGIALFLLLVVLFILFRITHQKDFNGNTLSSPEDEDLPEDFDQLSYEEKIQEAIEFIRVNAEDGDPEHQYLLGMMFATGKGPHGNGRHDRDMVQAANWFKKSASQGNADAQHALGQMYEQIGEEEKAARYYLMAAKQNHCPALIDLAMAFGAGRGVEKDLNKAHRLFLKAANLGDHFAEFMVGQNLFYGNGIEPNAEEAVKWYIQAAEAGEHHAQFEMGMIFEMGGNMQFANDWYIKAANQGNKDAIQKLQSRYSD